MTAPKTMGLVLVPERLTAEMIYETLPRRYGKTPALALLLALLKARCHLKLRSTSHALRSPVDFLATPLPGMFDIGDGETEQVTCEYFNP